MFVFKDVKYKNIIDINKLTIDAQQVTFIVGESGSGKTTLLRLLNKLISPDSGEICYRGEPLKSLDSVKHRRGVVMLPQSPVIFEGSIKDNLLIGREFSEKPAAGDDELGDILKRVNLNKPLTHNADNLSGGEKQRVALGRVLLMDPDVLLLDEPSSALDEETEKLIFDVLTAFARGSGKTLICVTHSKQSAKTYADRIIEMKKGSAKEAVS
jgi:putative ABC transport system ATP-binding protein